MALKDILLTSNKKSSHYNSTLNSTKKNINFNDLHDNKRYETSQNISEFNLEEFNRAFADYKGKILTLMSATTKFKENILIDIENHPDYIDYNLLKNINSNTTTTKTTSKKKK